MEYKELNEAAGTAIGLSLSEQSFFVKGSEKFVEDNAKKLLSIIKAAYHPPSQTASNGGVDNAASQIPVSEDRPDQPLPTLIQRAVESALIRFDRDTKLPAMQKTVPGKNKREQMRNVALILLYAADDALPASYLRNQCKQQSCFDSNNFSKAYETDREHFIKNGRPGSKDWTLELTIPGKKAAEDLISQTIAEQQGQ